MCDVDAAYCIPQCTDSRAITKQAAYARPCNYVDEAAAYAGRCWEQGLWLFQPGVHAEILWAVEYCSASW